jgi:stage II sporulation protein AB (anti-sigma F factor)
MTMLLQTSNQIRLHFPARPENEALARTLVAALVTPLDPLLDELDELRTAVSEAVTNAIIHGYEGNADGMIELSATISGNVVTVMINDRGKGIGDLHMAREPLYSSRPEWERAGMGFTIMEHLTDEMHVHSQNGWGTTVTLVKQFQQQENRAWH